MSSKKGFSTVLTIAALLFIFITFIIFFALFKADKEAGAVNSEKAFISIDTEYTLKTFLRTPSSSGPSDLGMLPGEQVTNADVLVRTCNADLDALKEYLTLKADARSYFDRLYGSEWLLFPIYYAPNGGPITPATVKFIRIEDEKNAGIPSPAAVISSAEFQEKLSTGRKIDDQAIALLELNVREPRVGTQILPCLNSDKIVKVVLLTKKKGVWT